MPQAMKVRLLLFLAGLLYQASLFACGGLSQPVYSGKMEYSMDSLNPFLCTLTVTMDFEVNEALNEDSIWVTWGDGDVQVIRGISITLDTLASGMMEGNNVYTHVYRGSHLYDSVPQGGYYYVSFQNEYRLNGLSNIAGGDGFGLPFCLYAQVGIDTAKRYTPLAFAPLGIGFSGLSTYTQPGLLQPATEGDSTVYGFGVPIEAPGTPVPEYLSPGGFCEQNEQIPDSFTIDPVSGAIVWNTPCSEGIYCFLTTLSKYRKGVLLSSVMREQNIYVSAAYTGVNAIKLSSDLKLNLCPDPAQQTLHGTLSGTVANGNYTADLISATGAVIRKEILISNNRFEADISTLPAGFYLIRLPLNNSGAAVTRKFEKQ